MLKLFSIATFPYCRVDRWTHFITQKLCSSINMNKNAAVLIVDDEVLKGNSQDLNYTFIVDKLNALGYNLAKICIIQALETVIAFNLKLCLQQYDIVIAIGTLEKSINVMYAATCRVFNQNIILSRDFRAIINSKKNCCKKNHFNNDFFNVLHACNAISNQQVNPVLYTQRLYLLTGNLEAVKLSFLHIVYPYLKNKYSEKYLKRNLIISCKDVNLIKNIAIQNNVELKYELACDVLKVNIVARTLDDLFIQEEIVRRQFRDYCLSVVENMDIVEIVYKQHRPHIHCATEYLETCFSKYGPENVFMSFNGGKDCTVLLHLTVAVLKKNYPNYKDKLFCMHVQNKNPFPELDVFISQCKQYYDLDIMTITDSIRDSLAYVLKEKPNLKACLMGTRRTDPFSSSLDLFQMTDSGWPQVMRVSPLLEWSYFDIWDYLLELGAPYCKLYDMGYTSLGTMSNTLKNPSLLVYDAIKDAEVYLPAFKLLDSAKERHGRTT